MKVKEKTPQESYDEAVRSAKNYYEQAIKKAKLKLKFRTAPPEGQAKMIDKLISAGDKSSAEMLWSISKRVYRVAIARAFFARAIIVTCRIQEGSYLNMGSMKMSKQHYSIIFKIRPGIELRHEVDYPAVPNDEILLAVGKWYFPSINRVDNVTVK